MTEETGLGERKGKEEKRERKRGRGRKSKWGNFRLNIMKLLTFN